MTPLWMPGGIFGKVVGNPFEKRARKVLRTFFHPRPRFPPIRQSGVMPPHSRLRPVNFIAPCGIDALSIAAMMMLSRRSFLITVALALATLASPAPAATPAPVDTSTVLGKVVCGYQGWFRCEGDDSKNGWHHYGNPAAGKVSVEMWPDMTGFGPDERFATAFKNEDGSTAEVFSSTRPATIQRHFEWMRDYGIDGAFLQRFATTTRDPRFRAPMDDVMAHVRESAAKTGRGWVLMYDLTGLKAGQSTVVIDDWKRLVNEKRVARDGSDAAYFKHRGKPLVALWGMGFKESALTLDDWAALITFFHEDKEFGGCSVMVGVPYWWRLLSRDCIADPRLHELLAKVDILSPWAVGRFGTPKDAAKRMDDALKPDLAWCAEHKVDYLPVIFPGFSWQNLSKGRGQPAKFDQIPRLGGQFLWSQALAAKRAGAAMAYVAMFDEMDEGTAIFKTTNHPPVGEIKFLADPSLPTDHYLWLVGQIAQMFKGSAPAGDELPVRK